MRTLRLLLPAMFAVALVPLVAGPASAAPPANDEAAGAVALHLGDRVEQDTTEATTNAGDDTLNTNCEAPATNASVWYEYSPTANHNVVVDATESDYTTGVMVFRGTPTADSLITCGPGGVGLRAHAGTTYTIMVFSDTEVMGGDLVLRLTNAPTPRVHVTVDKQGVAFHGGAAKVHGAYSCTHDVSFSEVTAHLYQRAGRLKIQGDGGTNLQCDGKRHHWSTRVVSPNGTYARGRAVATVRIISCGLLQCRQDKAKHNVHLAWSSKPHRAWMAHPTTGRKEHPRPIVGRQKHWPGS